MIRLLLLVSFVTACSELPDLGVCGNGIIEADLGEACDGGENCTAACVIACNAEGACADGQTCGSDNVCRAPSGRFAPTGIAHPFDMSNMRAGDFDADGITDLVGTNATQIAVLYGSSTTPPLARAYPQDLPSAYSPPAIYEREITNEDNSRLAIAIPTDGIALLLSDTETFQPRIDGAIVVEAAGRVISVVADPDGLLGDVVLEISEPQNFGRVGVKRAALPGVSEQDWGDCHPNGHLFDRFVSRDGESLVLAVGINNPDRWLLCVYRGTLGVERIFVDSFVPQALVLANVDSDECDEVAIARYTGMDTVVALVDVTGTECTFATTVTTLRTFAGTRTELLTAGPIVSNRDALVLANGVYTVTPGNALVPETPPMMGLRWHDATVTDLDRDGFGDVVAALRDQQNVEIVRGGRGGLSTYVVTTAVGVAGLKAGDFDGDGHGDAALLESGGSGQRISVLYGRADGPVAPPRPNSRFVQEALSFVVLRRFEWGNTARGRDGIDDLMVVRLLEDSTTQAAVGVMIGDASRVLTMPRFPVPPVERRPSVGTLVVGPFSGTAPSAISVRATSPTASELLTFDLESTFTSVPLDGFVVDETHAGTVLRTSASPLVVVISKVSQAAKPGPIMFDTTGVQCTGTPDVGISAVHAVDLDGDELDELAVLVPNERRVRVYEVTGGAACSIGAELLVDALDTCRDVARLGATIVAACSRSSPTGTALYRIVDGVREETPVAELDGVPLLIVPADYDGDGVTDLAILVGRGGINSIQFVRQCPAHDTHGCQ